MPIFWRDHGLEFPALASLARDVLHTTDLTALTTPPAEPWVTNMD